MEDGCLLAAESLEVPYINLGFLELDFLSFIVCFQNQYNANNTRYK